MKFIMYDKLEEFGADTLEILSENEVQNNLPISFIFNERGFDTSNWFLATIKDDTGSVLLTAACTPPFNITLYETGNKPNDAALKLLSSEAWGIGMTFPGVLAEQGLARRFAEIHVGENKFHSHMSLHLMQLDKINDIQKASGICRELREEDLFFVPFWEYLFSDECRIETMDILSRVERITKRIGKGTHFIWEDGHPVSQAFNGRNTQNAGSIGGVYTPPHYRGKGYAASVVAEVSKSILERGYKFCFLFADANNPISCGVYRKIGYNNLCVYDDLRFMQESKL
ncbi:MAG: GNAT family N-acetyltransferase [Oscillospiraceae bacterium]|nr:GNAT family N-acetyltransferase [Oscillospiraceae bacterium]